MKKTSSTGWPGVPLFLGRKEDMFVENESLGSPDKKTKSWNLEPRICLSFFKKGQKLIWESNNLSYCNDLEGASCVWSVLQGEFFFQIEYINPGSQPPF